ncbi:hypothetical protein ThrDRAFT_03593 [Frankia casuarinae]|jgi:hypothetical protein|nr:hypothetical protein CcI6DRAFT_03962 [Frankia sp. CcI6]EYT90751.1 hypothetical protein ThrDRAFT_03593 [Frankia casuarinae]KDA41599.1 hypothetical protein BMG523Draft_03601 [Frankia sp. BMG5.23]OAA20599.1 hypothetical protein AAY23_109210 [Frankia casuarinae]
MSSRKLVLATVGVAGAVGLFWREYPALVRYIRIEKM